MMNLAAEDLQNGAADVQPGPRPDIAGVLKTARIDAIVPMYDDLDAATAAIHS